MNDVMIQPWPAGVWRKSLADGLTDTEGFLKSLQLDPDLGGGSASVDAEGQFALRVPRAFASRIRSSDPNDGLLRQVLPVAEETEPHERYSTDPVGETASPPRHGVLQKYRGRALLMVTGACAVHCRYCFRRHFPYGEHTLAGEWVETLGQLAVDRSISEVILSGGDPLMLPDERLSAMVRDVASLSHLRRLRIHTRMPIVLPERVDETLVDWLSEIGIPLVMVVHANHPNEIDHDVRRGLAVLASTGVTLLNQTVLLAGVNDDAQVLADLSESLFESKVLPYYLHMLDPVAGATHFEVPNERALDIMAGLRRILPGYLVPRLVREIAGAPSKIPVELQE